ncbi:DUF294 nucleotidyltransferase-like domain-containing protein, partial [Photobacterium sp. OFAV2-7]|uniref:DUF294 nucleotidyltransferase-like domain-containing protein n=1 Tax=Photobacterium sp. OFAV2-7 TaxID=2917748 RepID=UPI001EF63E8D
QAMRKAHSSTAVVMEAEQIAGVITDRDMTKRVVAKGIDINQPVSQVMTVSPYTIEPEELILKAVSLMMQHNIRSLPVVSNNRVLGLLTTSNLVQNHRVQAIFLIEKIKDADSIEILSRLTPERQAIFEALVEGKVRSEIIGQVMAMIMDAYNRRLILLAEEKLGPPPCEYAWVVAGSHARNEVHMLSDQDNAIILSDTATASDRMYFNHLAMYVCNGLDACGYPLCTGKYMAASPKWCQPLRIWKEYYRKWVANPEYDMLLNAIVFMEVRVIYGETELSNQLQAYLHQQIATNGSFIGSLVRGTISVNPPLSIFNNLVVEKSGDNSNTLNIKKYAINLIVDLARIYSLSEGCQLTGTEERLRFVFERQLIAEDSLQDIIGAYRFITQVRFTHQFEALKQGKEPNNHIAPDAFGSFERKHLKDAFRIISNFQDLAKLRFNGE